MAAVSKSLAPVQGATAELSIVSWSLECQYVAHRVERLQLVSFGRKRAEASLASIAGSIAPRIYTIDNLRARWQRFKALTSLRLLLYCFFAQIADKQATESLL